MKDKQFATAQDSKVRAGRQVTRRGVLQGAAALGLGLPAAAQVLNAPAASAQSSAKELIWAGGIDISTLDGAFLTDVVSTSLVDLIYHHVVRYATDMSIEPDLAESWTTSDDQLTWTFTLKQGIQFSNGHPANAEAVKFTLDRVKADETASPSQSVYDAVSEVQVIDDYTVAIITGAPFPDLLTALADRAGAIVDPAEVQTYDDPQEYGLHPVGSGPFMLSEWESGIQLSLVPNPKYAGSPPALERITYKPVPEAGTRMAMLQSGEADLISDPVLEELDNLRADKNLKVRVEPGYNFIMFEMLTDKKPLDDVRVRQAINYAVDKQSIADDLLNGLVEPACSTVSPGVGPDFYQAQPCYDYDPDKAKQLLADAGYGNGFEMEMWSPSGRYLKDAEIAQTVQAYLGAVGINAKLQTWEWATYRDKWSAPDRTMWMIGRSTGNADFMFTRLFAKSEWDQGANNNTHFADPRVEDLLVKARSTFDVKQRASYYHEIQKITWEYAPALYLHTEDVVLAQRANVTGVDVLPYEVLRLEHASKTS